MERIHITLSFTTGMVVGEVNDNKIWERIVKVAQADGHITEEETKLMKGILSNAKSYDQVLSAAIDDGTIDEQEKNELINLRADILDKAYRDASDDQKISDDEYAIIQETLKILRELELEENKFM